MTVYLMVDEQGCRYATADDEQEGADFARELALAVDALRLAGTARWHYRLTEADWEWAVTAGARVVDLAVFQMLVMSRRVGAGERPPGVIVCGPPPRRPAGWNPKLRRHRWVKDREHWKHCGWCGLEVENRPGERGRWWQRWRWPGSTSPGGWDGSTLDSAGVKVPPCPGPSGRADLDLPAGAPLPDAPERGNAVEHQAPQQGDTPQPGDGRQ